MNFSTVSYILNQRIGMVQMNRPERRNALNDVLIRELTEVIQTLGRTSSCKVIILSGTEKVFCSGMDLKYLHEISGKTHEENVEDAMNLVKLLMAIYTLKKPVIAMVNGPALGGGCGIAAVCDYIFAGKEHARFGVPEVGIGFLPAVILPFLIKRMGEGRAKEFVLQGEVINAVQAKERSLITDAIAESKLPGVVNEFALKLVSTTSANAVALTKEFINRCNELDFKDSLEFAANVNALARKTEDFRKGIESFIRKEKIEW